MDCMYIGLIVRTFDCMFGCRYHGWEVQLVVGVYGGMYIRSMVGPSGCTNGIAVGTLDCMYICMQVWLSERMYELVKGGDGDAFAPVEERRRW